MRDLNRKINLGLKSVHKHVEKSTISGTYIVKTVLGHTISQTVGQSSSNSLKTLNEINKCSFKTKQSKGYFLFIAGAS